MRKFLLAILFLGFAFALPSVEFVSPTPDNGNVTHEKWIYVNASVNGTGNLSAFIDFNNSLVGYWSFENTSGTTVYDSSTYGNNGTYNGETFNDGTLTNGPTWTTGKYGNGLSFDGTDDNVTIGTAGLPSGDSTRTIMAWFKTDSITGQMIFTYGTGADGQVFYLAVYPITDCGAEGGGNAQGTVIVGVGGTGSNICGNDTVTDGIWHHVAAVYNGTDIFIYIDGSLKNSGSRSANTVLSNAVMGSGFSGEYFNGTIDSTRVFSRALNESEIQNEMNSSKPIIRPIAGYEFEEGSGTAAYDTHNVLDGQFGGAASFDGTDDYISSLDSNAWNFGTRDFAIETWIKPTEIATDHFIGTAYYGGWWNGGWGFYVYDTGKLGFGIAGTDEIQQTASGSLVSGAWQHIAVVRNSGTVTFYVNGISQGGGAYASSLPNSILRIATFNSGNDFNGLMDEVRIWNRALSEEEINASYDAGSYRLERNFTNLKIGNNYSFYASIMDSNGISNKTETRAVSVSGYPISINFTSPTPANDSAIYDDSIYINTTINGTGNMTAFIDFERSLDAYWSFDNMSGTMAYDSSTYGRNGWINNGLAAGEGKFGDALAFDGSDDYFEANSGYDYLTDDTFTASAWINPSAIAGDYRCIVAKVGSYYYGDWTFGFHVTDTGALQGTINTVAGVYTLNSDPEIISTNAWQHVLLRYNSTNLTIYLNGNPVASRDASGTLFVSGAQNPVHVGMWFASVPYWYPWYGMYPDPNWFNGKIDEVQIWNTALSDDEIHALYGAGTYGLHGNFTTADSYGTSYSFYAYVLDTYGDYNRTETRTVTKESQSLPISVSFVSPTLANGSTTNNNWIYVNSSINGTGNLSGFIDFDRSLVAYFSFDNVSGNIIYDYSTYGNNATNQGATTAFGKFRNGISTTGGQFIELPTPIDLGYEWTIETWFVSPLPGTNDGWRTLTRGSSMDHQVMIHPYGNLGVYDNSYYGFVDCGFDMNTLSSGWHHLAAVGKTNGYTYFYIDGAYTCNSSFRSTSDIYAIGNYQGGNQWFGTIDEFKVWKKALSEQEVNSSYNANAYRLENNFTNLAFGRNYSFYAYSVDQYGNFNTTETRTISTELPAFPSSSISVSLVPPTNENNTLTTESWIYVNTSISGTASPFSGFIDLDRSLLGYWSFDNISGTTVYDSSTYGSNGTMANGSSQDIGKFGYSMRFDGVDDYVSMDSSSLNVVGEISVEAWIYPTRVDISDQQAISSRGGGWGREGWLLTLSNNVVRWHLGNGWSETYFDTATTISANTWTHVVATCRQNVMRVYINGVEDSNNASWGGCAVGNSYTHYIGRTDGGWPMAFNGLIDEVRIWDRALGGDEINASYDANAHRLEKNFTELTLGNHTFYAYAIDQYGNSSRSEEYTVKTYGVACGPMTESGEYTMNQNISSVGITCITFATNNTVLDCNGYSITGNNADGTYGLYANGYSNITVRNCDISGYASGVYFESSENNSFSNVRLFSNPRYGIHFLNSNGSSFSNITLYNNTEWTCGWCGESAAYFTNSFNNSFSNSSLYNNTGNGIVLENSGFNLFADVFIINHTGLDQGWGNRGLYITNSYNNSFANIASNGNRYGLYIYSSLSQNNTFVNVSAYDNNKTGAIIGGSDNFFESFNLSNNSENLGIGVAQYFNNSYVDGRLIYSIIGAENLTVPADVGIVLIAHSRNITVENQTLYKNEEGVMVFNSSYVYLNNITAYNNSWAGIYLEETNNSVLSNLTVHYSYDYVADYGVYFYLSSNNTLDNLTVYYTHQPLLIENSDYNSFSNIVSYDNTGEGIWVSGSSYNTISNVLSYISASEDPSGWQWTGFYIDDAGWNPRVYSSNNTFANITLYHLDWSGFYIDSEGENNSYYNITIHDIGTGDAAFYSYGYNSIIDGMTCYNSPMGLYLDYAENWTITNSDFSGNTGNGVYLSRSVNITLENITANRNVNNGLYADTYWYYCNYYGQCGNHTINNFMACENTNGFEFDNVGIVGSGNNGSVISSGGDISGFSSGNCSISADYYNVTGCRNLVYPGTVRLMNNITFSPSYDSRGQCMRIKASNLTFDLNGYSLICTGSYCEDWWSEYAAFIQIINSSTNITIKNGELIGTGRGIGIANRGVHIWPYETIQDLTVQNITFRDLDSAMHISESNRTNIIGNFIYDVSTSSYYGWNVMYVYGANMKINNNYIENGFNVQLTRSWTGNFEDPDSESEFRNNVWMNYSSLSSALYIYLPGHILIEKNNITGDANADDYAIYANSRADVRNNTIANTQSNGIMIVGENSSAYGNIVYNTTYGIYVAYDSSNISRNRLYNNQYGIYAVSSNNEISNNNLCKNNSIAGAYFTGGTSGNFGSGNGGNFTDDGSNPLFSASWENCLTTRMSFVMVNKLTSALYLQQINLDGNQVAFSPNLFFAPLERKTVSFELPGKVCDEPGDIIQFNNVTIVYKQGAIDGMAQVGSFPLTVQCG